MGNLNERVRRLEAAASQVDLKAMTDDELAQYAEAHWREPPWGSRECVAAVLTMVQRQPSAMPIVHDDPDFCGNST